MYTFYAFIATSCNNGVRHPLDGLSQAPGFAEFMVAIFILRAVFAVQVCVCLLIDSWNVVRALRMAQRSGHKRLPRFSIHLWWEASQLFHGLEDDVFWVLSHGKSNDWKPPPPFVSHAASWRILIQAADELATKAVNACVSRCNTLVCTKGESDLDLRASALLSRRHHVSDAYFLPFRQRHHVLPTAHDYQINFDGRASCSHLFIPQHFDSSSPPDPVGPSRIVAESSGFSSAAPVGLRGASPRLH